MPRPFHTSNLSPSRHLSNLSPSLLSLLPQSSSSLLWSLLAFLRQVPCWVPWLLSILGAVMTFGPCQLPAAPKKKPKFTTLYSRPFKLRPSLPLWLPFSPPSPCCTKVTLLLCASEPIACGSPAWTALSSLPYWVKFSSAFEAQLKHLCFGKSPGKESTF